jgi:hypothetical protein
MAPRPVDNEVRVSTVLRICGRYQFCVHDVDLGTLNGSTAFGSPLQTIARDMRLPVNTVQGLWNRFARDLLLPECPCCCCGKLLGAGQRWRCPTCNKFFHRTVRCLKRRDNDWHCKYCP